MPCSKSDSCLSLSSYSASGGEMDVDNPSSALLPTDSAFRSAFSLQEDLDKLTDCDGASSR